ncbi:ROK family transcriptional regulator [Notoacmeibacter sp. MSK16QG-6]|uniref:ROK family transcriptional regulator n=1 Tax=Notoacmeibacter sp. MSK16QG-6 TaxID=2957982 RepID=UPI00209E3C30|nr:ROK family transcriptional regulator [Notoacmeibacter sp. MSK16QG-6]MCP1198669.1 ROK family transcriptional regulator [Notoacmeibacter sp. MSK16QG-6]
MAGRTVATRPDDMRRINRERVLFALRRAGQASRNELARHTALSAASISTITGELIDEGLVVAAGDSDIQRTGPTRGRPRIALMPSPTVASLACLALQFGNLSIRLVDYCGQVLHAEQMDCRTLELSDVQLIEAMEGLVQAALSATGRRAGPLQGIVIGVAGVIDLRGTTIRWAPALSVRDVPVADGLGEKLGVPVRLWNDCDLMAEALHGEGFADGGDFGTLLLSRGVGMALRLRGQLINGLASSGVEFGHIPVHPEGALCRCGNYGCVEAYAGDYAMARRAAGLSGRTPPAPIGEVRELASIAEQASNGSKDAAAALAEAGAAVGYGLASIFSLVDPFPLMIVGLNEDLRRPLTESIRATLGKTLAGKAVADELVIDGQPDPTPLVHRGAALSGLATLDRTLVANPTVAKPAGGEAA